MSHPFTEKRGLTYTQTVMSICIVCRPSRAAVAGADAVVALKLFAVISVSIIPYTKCDDGLKEKNNSH